MTFLILHEIGHLAIYLLGAALVWMFFNKNFSRSGFTVGLVTAFAMDLDHLFDYLLFRGVGFGFDLWEFLSGSYFIENGRALVLFHGWEYALILLGLFFLQKGKNRVRRNWMLFIAVSMVVHLIWDTVSYDLGAIDYSIIYRVLKNLG